MNGTHRVGGGYQPAFINAKQAAALLSISERKLHELRAAGLVPEPVVLGPRALRWVTAELIEHVSATAPRGSMSEPAHLKARRCSTRREA